MPLHSITGKSAVWLIVATAASQFSACGSGLAAERQSTLSQALAQTEQMLASLPPPSVKQVWSSQPFDEVAVAISSGDVSDKWRAILTKINAETATLDRCRIAQECSEAARAFLEIVAQGASRYGLARIGLINRAVNMAIIPTSDMKQWGVADRWSPPLETLRTGRGDCEDYAIVKYAALIDSGVAKDDVKLVIVRNRFSEQDHAVVAARVGDAWVILDNRSFALAPADKLRGATPLYVLDEAGTRIFVPGIPGNGIS